MSWRRWPPPPIVEEEAVSLAKEMGYERHLTDENYVPARGVVDQGPVLVEVYQGLDRSRYHERTSSASGAGSGLDVGYSDLTDSPVSDRGRQVDSSLLDDDSIASTIFTHRSPSPYAYTQSSSSPRPCQRDNYHGLGMSLDDGVADLVRSSPNSPISPKDKGSKPFVLNTPESNPIDSCSESECSCCSSCSECEGEASDDPHRSTNLQARKHVFSGPSSKRRHTESKVRIPTASSIRHPTTPPENGIKWISPSSGSRREANRGTSQTRPELRLSTPNSRKGSPTPIDLNPHPSAEPNMSGRSPRPCHQHSWSCNAIPQSPTLNKPQRIVDYGGAVDEIRGQSVNLSPTMSPKSRSGHNISFVSKSEDIPHIYHSQPISQRSQRSGSPVTPSQVKYAGHRQSQSASSPLFERPAVIREQNSFRTRANTGTPQIVVQPPAEEKVPVTSAFPEDDTIQLDLSEPEYPLPTDKGMHFERRDSPTYHAEQATRVNPIYSTAPKMARSYSDNPRSGPCGNVERNISETISLPAMWKRSDGFMTTTEDFYSRYDATPLPPCPRTNHVPYDDWFVLRGSRSLVICPGCIKNIIPPLERHRFVRASPSCAGPTTICDFSCSWIRAAWLMASRGRAFDQMFLERISYIKPDDMGCLLRRYLGAGGWYKLRSRHGVQGDELLICASCTKRMSAILPSMGDEVKRISRKRINSSPICVFGPQNQYAASLVGSLVTAQVAAFRSRAPLIDLSQFVAQVRSQQNLHENTCGNGISDARACDVDGSKEGRKENRRWHIVPQLTACTVCEQCFDEAVWPELEAGHPLAQMFTTDKTSGRRGSKSPHGLPYASGSSSPSPRRHDRWGRRSYHRRRSSRHNEFDDDVFSPESSYNRKPEDADFKLAIAGDGQGTRAGGKDDDGLNRICYLHSPSMRSAWQKALRTNDFGVFETEVLRLKNKEVGLRERIVQLRFLREEKMRRRYGNRLGDGFFDLHGNSRRSRRKSMGSIDSRPEVQPLPIIDFKEDIELKRLEWEWKQLGSIF